ncbi:gll3812 [Gloeobacter violaceus PCC 7421]|uniref:Gll3812 protein n=2 Tax=Gloeobacter violaceus TaxID=33072 RepID=Q7NER6_GLOVI|nr:gll3812 [Gloeobacter violaceus PCC 7421]
METSQGFLVRTPSARRFCEQASGDWYYLKHLLYCKRDNTMSSELFDEYVEHGPENKLELIESRLVVGNSLLGSRLLLRQLLQGWSPAAAVALAPVQLWLQALKMRYGVTVGNDDIADLSLHNIGYELEDLRGGYRGDEHSHNGVRQYLNTSLFRVAREVGGNALGRDFAMRLGENGFTPDAMFFTGTGLNRLCNYYLNGPAELVIEVLRPGHEHADRVIKRNYYQAAGVPEYWIVDPRSRSVEFWSRRDGVYLSQFPDRDGLYRPGSVAGLAFRPEPLWQDANWYGGSLEELFFLEGSQQPFESIPHIQEGAGWGSLPFVPDLQLEPAPIGFDQYISWCPEAKFEYWEDRPQIGGAAGVRNLLGMLLATFGLVDVLNVLPPQSWIEALQERIAQEQQDTEHKAQWWHLVRQAAAMLRENFGIVRLGVIGDLVRSQPLNYWSDVTLVAWDAPQQREYEIYQALSGLGDSPQMRLLDAERGFKTAEEQQAIAEQLVPL